MRNTFVGVAGLAALSATFSAGAVAPALDPQPYEQVVPVKEEPAAAPIGIGAVKVTLGGFIKLDALFSVFSDGRVASTDQGRDYFRPVAIPVASAASADPRSMLDFHAKDSRFSFKIDTEVSGHALGGLLELDYRTVAGGASEAVTNGFTPRLRRAFVTYDEWTLGQDWTTFRNADAAPEHIDDIGGPVEALNIVRQPVIRYTLGGLAVALENSESYLLPNAASGSAATFVTGDSKLPDLVARYDLKTGFGTFAAGALVRELRADRAATGGTAPFDVADGTAFAWGANLSGKLPTFMRGEVRFGLDYGDGLGRYVGLATLPDAVIAGDGSLDTLSAGAGYVSYHQVWNGLFRSNLTLGTLQISNDASLTGASATKAVDSAQVNLLYEPAAKLLFGLEYLHAIRTIENGESGNLDRVQFSAKYSF